MSVIIEGLEDSFDNDLAEEMLNLSIDKITYTSELVRKSIYDFDLETPEGIEKLMALLPIMDPEILKDIMAEIWPGYPTDIDARRHRLEIKGYLKDYLESYEQEDSEEQLDTGTESGTSEAEEAPEAAGAEGNIEEPTSADNISGSSESTQDEGLPEQTTTAKVSAS